MILYTRIISLLLKQGGLIKLSIDFAGALLRSTQPGGAGGRFFNDFHHFYPSAKKRRGIVMIAISMIN